MHSNFCSFSCLSYPDVWVGGFCAPEWPLLSPLNILEGFFIIRLDTLHGEVITAVGLVGFGALEGFGAPDGLGAGAEGAEGGTLNLFSCFL